MIGVRRDDVEHLADLEPGEYARRSAGMMWVCLPNGEHSALPVGDGWWSVAEEADGSLTLHPSINLVGERSWHGWLRSGVWESADA